MSQVFWAQVRRIDCEHCGVAYSYVMGGTEELLRAEELASADKRGQARCPHCHRYQEWMVMGSSFKRAGAVVAAALAAIFAGAVASISLSTGMSMLVATGVAIVCMPLAWVLGTRSGQTTDAAPEATSTFGVLDAELPERAAQGAIAWMRSQDGAPEGLQVREMALRNEARSTPPV